MEKSEMQVYDLTDLGIRVFHTFDPDAPRHGAITHLHYTHKHGYYELHIMLSGSCVLQAGDAIYPVEEGQFALVAPDVDHLVTEDAIHNNRYCTSFEVMKKPMPVSGKLQQQTKDSPVWIGDASGMLGIVERLQAEYKKRKSFSKEVKHRLNDLLVLELVRSMEIQPVLPQPAKNDSDEARSILIDIFLNGNFYLSAGEEELAKYLGVSRRQLDRILKKLYSKSYREKAMEIRAQVACDLLRHSDMSIREISEQVGYSTPSNFTTFFKNAKGMTPQQYRAKHLGRV